jgi:hypothetical protein
MKNIVLQATLLTVTLLFSLTGIVAAGLILSGAITW